MTTADSISVAQKVCTLVAAHIAHGHPLRVLGLSGPPGTGKSTVAALVADMLETQGIPFAGFAPMDGFHMANAELDQRDLHNEKGSPRTFDVWGYASLLQRIQHAQHPVLAPIYRRDLHEPVAGASTIDTTGVCITEGNYLALPQPGWQDARACVDLLIHIHTPYDQLLRRLVERQVRFGRHRADAAHWVRTVDAANIRLVKELGEAADFIVEAEHPEA